MRIWLFQSRTGFPGHFAQARHPPVAVGMHVSNPNGLPRPFRLERRPRWGRHLKSFKPERASQAISPAEIVKTFSNNSLVSNPNGLPRPFRLLSCGLQENSILCFKPERASQAISPVRSLAFPLI